MWNLSQTKIVCFYKISVTSNSHSRMIWKKIGLKKLIWKMFFTFVLFYLLRSCTFGWPKGSWKCPKRLPRSPLYFRLLQFGHSERNQTTHEKNCHRLDAWSHWGREMQVKIILSKSLSYSIHFIIWSKISQNHELFPSGALLSSFLNASTAVWKISDGD